MKKLKYVLLSFPALTIILALVGMITGLVFLNRGANGINDVFGIFKGEKISSTDAIINFVLTIFTLIASIMVIVEASIALMGAIKGVKKHYLKGATLVNLFGFLILLIGFWYAYKRSDEYAVAYGAGSSASKIWILLLVAVLIITVVIGVILTSAGFSSSHKGRHHFGYLTTSSIGAFVVYLIYSCLVMVCISPAAKVGEGLLGTYIDTLLISLLVNIAGLVFVSFALTYDANSIDFKVKDEEDIEELEKRLMDERGIEKVELHPVVETIKVDAPVDTEALLKEEENKKSNAVKKVVSDLEKAQMIKSYKNLLDKEAITKEEYDAKKAEILAM